MTEVYCSRKAEYVDKTAQNPKLSSVATHKCSNKNQNDNFFVQLSDLMMRIQPSRMKAVPSNCPLSL